VNTVIGTDDAWHTEKPGRLRVGRAGTRFPPLRTRVRVGVECSDHESTRHDWRRAQVQGGLSTYSSAAHHHNGRRAIQIDPATLFVPPNRVVGKRSIPGLLESLFYHRFVEEIRNCWCLHPPFRLTAIPDTNTRQFSLPERAANFKRRPGRRYFTIWTGSKWARERDPSEGHVGRVKGAHRSRSRFGEPSHS
jgi:hypothetical protein